MGLRDAKRHFPAWHLGGIRVSTHFHDDDEDVDRLLHAAARLPGRQTTAA